MRRPSLFLAAVSRSIGSKTRPMSDDGGGAPSGENILAESWSAISRDYERVLAPRFAPWERDALDALRIAAKEDAKREVENAAPKALVLCCGPGHELLPIAKILGTNSEVLGTDLAPGMVETARERIEEDCGREGGDATYGDRITAEVGNAQEPPAGPYDVVYSAFGLQQLPRPMQAVQEWMNVLRYGGICAFIYWPPGPPKIQGEDNSPFSIWGNLVSQKLGRHDEEEEPWDKNISSVIMKAGGVIISDECIAHEIRWDDPRAMFDGMSRAGPWHAMRLRRGDCFVDELGAELLSAYFPGEPLRHKSAARLIVARRLRSGEGHPTESSNL